MFRKNRKPWVESLGINPSNLSLAASLLCCFFLSLAYQSEPVIQTAFHCQGTWTHLIYGVIFWTSIIRKSRTEHLMLDLLLHSVLFTDVFLQATLSLSEGHWYEDWFQQLVHEQQHIPTWPADERCCSAPEPTILIVHGTHRHSPSSSTNTQAGAETSAEMVTPCLLWRMESLVQYSEQRAFTSSQLNWAWIVQAPQWNLVPKADKYKADKLSNHEPSHVQFCSGKPLMGVNAITKKWNC